MNPDPLDQLLRDYARQPLPSPPSHVQATVWREITDRKCDSGWLGLNTIQSWGDLFARPRIALVGLLVALITGMMPVAAATLSQETPRKVRDSLHLACFTSCPSCVCGNMRTDSVRR